MNPTSEITEQSVPVNVKEPKTAAERESSWSLWTRQALAIMRLDPRIRTSGHTIG